MATRHEITKKYAKEYKRASKKGSDDAEQRLQVLYAQTNPADLTRNINRIQQALIVSAKDKTLTLRDQVS